MSDRLSPLRGLTQANKEIEIAISVNKPNLDMESDLNHVSQASLIVNV